MKLIHSLELEKYLLAGILRNPETFTDLDGFIDENDFVNNLHKTIYGVIRQTIRNQEKIEKVLIAQKINILSLSFEDKVSDILGYLTDLSLIQINHSSVVDIAEELKLVTLRRELSQTGEKIADEMSRLGQETDQNAIISAADAIYNNKISLWDKSGLLPENICEELPELLRNKGLNPHEELGFKGPYPMLHRLYGSLLRPGNISVICSRSGSGKTTFLNDLFFKTAEIHNNVPVLHFDNGEMLKEELQMRLAASLSGVPLHLLETGKFAKDRDMVAAVNKISDRLKKHKFYYYNVAGKSVKDMLTILRRFYISKIGRGNDLLFCFDYIKSTSERNTGNRAEYEVIGQMVTQFKDILSSEIIIPMASAVQGNRSGIVTNRMSDAIIDDESVFSGGDRTIFFSSQAYILRKKTNDEFGVEQGKWGTHKLINIKARHLGEDIKRALNMVKIGEKYKGNYINLEIENFHVTEKGDLKAQADSFEKMDIKEEVEDVDI